MTLFRIIIFVWGLMTFTVACLMAKVLALKIPAGQPLIEAIQGDKGLQLVAIMLVMSLINTLLTGLAISIPRKK